MESIGKYQIVSELGTGGFGTVYKANDPGMGRMVAIKVLNAQDDAGMVKRFQAEAKMAANLRHPNIVTVFDFGEENGKLFLVMEYLDGTTLGGLIAAQAQLSAVEKLSIMREAALGLKATHERGIVHRDVKPTNIMRLSDGSVKIMDFGISRATSSLDTRLTQTGYVLGTPAFMAPEQFTEGDTDVLCDIWAYGVVLYEFLTGTNPFHAPTPAQIIYRLTTEEPLPLSSYLPGLPERLEGAVQRLLSKKRDRRYQTMEGVCFDLEAILLEMRQPEIERLTVQKAYDWNLWILPMVQENFPKSYRFSVGQNLVATSLDLLMNLVDATYQSENFSTLVAAVRSVNRLHYLMRLSKDLRLLNISGYELAAKGLDEIGRLAGEWRKSAKAAGGTN